jgi:excinuclease UvrABC nuclease subunit
MNNNITVSKKDAKLFQELLPNSNLTHYFKTKDNILRIALFDDNHFIAIETPKGFGLFEQTVINQDEYKVYNIQETKHINNPDGSLKNAIYLGNRNPVNI